MANVPKWPGCSPHYFGKLISKIGFKLRFLQTPRWGRKNQKWIEWRHKVFEITKLWVPKIILLKNISDMANMQKWRGCSPCYFGKLISKILLKLRYLWPSSWGRKSWNNAEWRPNILEITKLWVPKRILLKIFLRHGQYAKMSELFSASFWYIDIKNSFKIEVSMAFKVGTEKLEQCRMSA